MPDISDEAERRQVLQAFDRLYAIIRRLRAPDGCPWDREQTPETMRGSLVEEAYECVSAIEEGDVENLREELGDLMLVSTMIAYMSEQEGRFKVAEVFDEICAKLVRRHPHVFGEVESKTAGEVLQQWEQIKEHVEGKKAKHSVLERVPRTLPPLERAYLIQQKVGKIGFDWKEPGPVWEKLAEEIGELKQAHGRGDQREVERELGDLLFTVVNLGRLMKVDPTLALNGTNQKFVGRFQELERRLAAQGLNPKGATLEQMDGIWEQIKTEERGKA